MKKTAALRQLFGLASLLSVAQERRDIQCIVLLFLLADRLLLVRRHLLFAALFFAARFTE
jgi:hypothetical protein